MYQKTVLGNGLRIITSPMPHTRSVCLSIFIGAGSRYEASEEAGISHFIEHLCFKGTERRQAPRELFETIEGVGGILNGGTDKEMTLYWSKVARPHFLISLDLLTDMLRHSRFDPVDIEKEKGVIIDELNDAMDHPDDRVGVLIDEVLWPDQPLGREVMGSKETVKNITRPMVSGCLSHQYVPVNTVVSVAGDISHEEVVSSLGEVLGDWHGGEPKPCCHADDSQDRPRLHLERRDIEQAHLCLGVRGLAIDHPDRFTLDLVSTILGEGMSSRLFQEIRENRGLAYDIHSYVNHFLDSGSLIIYTGVAPRVIDDAIEAILEELRRLRDDGVPESELVKAKEMVKGRLLLRMEDTRSVAGWVGAQELLSGKVRTVDEAVSIIDSITAPDINGVARELLITEKLNLAVVGPLSDEMGLERLLRI